MASIQVTSAVEKKDFRAATYFNSFLQTPKLILVATGMILVVLVLWLIQLSGVAEVPQMALSGCSTCLLIIPIFYLVVEAQVQQFFKSDTQFLGTEYTYTFSEEHLHVEVAGIEGITGDYPWEGFRVGYETKTHFLLFVNEQQLFIIAKRYFTPQEMLNLRQLLDEKLGDRFDRRVK